MLRFSFDQLQAFIAVAEQGSFSKAARELKKDRSTIHQQVGNLEIDLGLTLFDRSGKFPVMTEAARPLFRYALLVIRQAEQLQSVSESLYSRQEPELTIYHDITLPVVVIRRMDAELRQQFPDTQIHWLHRGKQEGVDALLSGKADLSIAMNSARTMVPPKGIAFINLGFMAFHFYTACDSSLQQLPVVTLNELQSEQQYMLENYANAGLGETLRMSARNSMISNMDVLLGLLQDSGWAILPLHIAESEEYRGRLKRLEVDFLNHVGRWGYALLYCEQGETGPVKTAAMEAVKKQFRMLLAEE
ncbi:LysR family transcriptional regulator [Photobacterium sp. OFAV2-7]|uniref:LysR family transcriptional regulator n=1 Tax=Photobacterium sp. OFAV2-7 TaxID=2917748 RepID=UPI001EF42ACE|nr:LysR family transcriptional regulator [Photobacterium sp. OFAV2-7]MCG7585065.1 LysR family transcriptional regulator [Photobacterium sp. OFAV2-7]